jgi:hypothetical protein
LGGKVNKPLDMFDEDWKIFNRKELGSIHLFLAQLMVFNISIAKTMKDLMSNLAKLYEKPLASNKVFLMKRLFNIKMIEGGSVTNHLNEFNTITS